MFFLWKMFKEFYWVANISETDYPVVSGTAHLRGVLIIIVYFPIWQVRRGYDVNLGSNPETHNVLLSSTCGWIIVLSSIPLCDISEFTARLRFILSVQCNPVTGFKYFFKSTGKTLEKKNGRWWRCILVHSTPETSYTSTYIMHLRARSLMHHDSYC